MLVGNNVEACNFTSRMVCKRVNYIHFMVKMCWNSILNVVKLVKLVMNFPLKIEPFCDLTRSDLDGLNQIESRFHLVKIYLSCPDFTSDFYKFQTLSAVEI